MSNALLIPLAVAALLLVWLWRRQRGEVARLEASLLSERQAHAAVREKLDHALAEAREREVALFNSMDEGVLILDQDLRILLANHALRSLFGLETDPGGRRLIEAFQMHELEELAASARATGRASIQELAPRNQAGRVVQVNAAVIGEPGPGTNGILFVFHDLTRVRQLEQTRREFVANVSHELRTPLSMIKGYVETLIDGASKDPEVASRFLGIIERHTNRLTYLIEDLLLLSRLESGPSILSLHTLQIAPLANRTVEDLLSKAEAKGTRIVNEIPEHLAAAADGDRLQQVLFNLIDNAIKYGRPNGTVILGGQDKDDESIELWVRDDGPGIPPEARDRVFERFYRVDKARSRDLGGTGLGLAIVKHIILQHGGEVWVTSPPGQGAEFHFTLRRPASAAALPASPAGNTP